MQRLALSLIVATATLPAQPEMQFDSVPFEIPVNGSKTFTLERTPAAEPAILVRRFGTHVRNAAQVSVSNQGQTVPLFGSAGAVAMPDGSVSGQETVKIGNSAGVPMTGYIRTNGWRIVDDPVIAVEAPAPDVEIVGSTVDVFGRVRGATGVRIRGARRVEIAGGYFFAWDVPVNLGSVVATAVGPNGEIAEHRVEFSVRGSAGPTDGVITLPSRRIIPLTQLSHLDAVELGKTSTPPFGSTGTRGVLRFTARPTKQDLESYPDRLGYLRPYGWLVNRDLVDPRNIPDSTLLAPFTPADRLSAKLRASAVGAHAIAGPNRFRMVVRFHQDATAGDVSKAFSFAQVNNQTGPTDRRGTRYVATLSRRQILLLSTRNEIAFMTEIPSPAEDAGREGDLATTTTPHPTLDGDGVTVGMWESGVPKETTTFSGRIDLIDAVTPTTHAYDVATTFGGASAADKVKIRAGTYVDTEVPKAQADACAPNDASITPIDVANNSWSRGSSDLAEYTDESQQYDELVYDLDRTLVFAAGKYREGYNRSVPRAGTPAKNCVTAGAYGGAIDEDGTFVTTNVLNESGSGPTDDLRLRPHVVADAGSSSIATAKTTLAVIRMIQAHRAVTGSTDARPGSATIRAALAASADDIDHWPVTGTQNWGSAQGPDHVSGYGALDETEAIELVKNGDFRELAIREGEEHKFAIDLGTNEKNWTFVLSWNDPPPSYVEPHTESKLVNDLDIRIEGDNGDRYYPWRPSERTSYASSMTSLSSSETVSFEVQDRRHNCVMVTIPDAEPGEYAIYVTPHAIEPSTSQAYSLVGRHLSTSTGSGH